MADLTPHPEPRPASRPDKGRALNHRRALAGLYLLEGQTIGKALVRAGFSPATARNPEHNGLGADRCLAEAKRLRPAADAGGLVDAARRAVLDRLQSDDVGKERLADVVRAWDVAERFHGAGADQDRERGEREQRSLDQRASFLGLMVAEAQRRGLVASGENAGSQVIEAHPVSDEDAQGLEPGRTPPARD